MYRGELFLVVGTLLILSTVYGAPRHHLHKQPVNDVKGASRSYIDIDATDPFKVPKSSHYMDQSMPDFDKSEANGRAIVENNEAGGGVGGGTGGEEEPQVDQSMEDGGMPLNEESAPSQEGEPQGDNNGGSQLNDGLNSDLPASVTNKINEMTSNTDSNNGKPIEIDEKDLQNLIQGNGSKNNENTDDTGGPSPEM